MCALISFLHRKISAAVHELRCTGEVPQCNFEDGEDIFVYKKCQEFEQKRIEFFKKTLFQLHACLDLSVEPKFSQIYTSLHSTINNLDYSKDLKWWSCSYGVDMPMNWPEYEEYSPELQSISKRGKSNLNTGDGGIVFTGIKHSREDSMGSYTNDSSTGQNQQPQVYRSQQSSNSIAAASSGDIDSSATYDEAQNPFDDDDEEVRVEGDGESDKGESSKKESFIKPVRTPRNIDKVGKGQAYPSAPSPNPFGESDRYEDDDEDETEDPPSQGWSVRALYDYERAEEDELQFKAGDVFVQIATEDEMGWCKGRKDGKIGFYPKNYVVRV